MTGRSSWRRAIGSFRERPPASAADCKDHEPPRDSQRRAGQLAERFAEFGAIGSRFLEGLLASTRYGKNQAERVLSLRAAYPRHDVLSALERAVRVRRLLPGGRATHPGGAQPTQDTAGRAGRRPSVLPGQPAREATRRRPDPPPTIKTCLREEPDDGGPITPRGKTTPERPAQDDRDDGTRRSLHDDVTAALRTLGIAVTPAALDAALSAAERESLSHLEFLHRLLAGPAEARRQRARRPAAPRSEVPRTDHPGRV